MEFARVSGLPLYVAVRVLRVQLWVLSARRQSLDRLHADAANFSPYVGVTSSARRPGEGMESVAVDGDHNPRVILRWRCSCKTARGTQQTQEHASWDSSAQAHSTCNQPHHAEGRNFFLQTARRQIN